MTAEPICPHRCHHLVPCDGSCTSDGYHHGWDHDEYHVFLHCGGLPRLPHNTACEQFNRAEVDA